MTFKERVEIGEHVLYLGDCREILPTISADAVVTDPPYGIGRDGSHESSGSHGGRRAYDFAGWDQVRPTRELFDLMMSRAQHHVIWGGNYFADRLPPKMGWLIWDKDQDICGSDAELAYTSRDEALRRFRKNRVVLKAEGANHPTQKPIEVMAWCLSFFPDAQTVLDPFMGSGTTGVACAKLGRRFIGVEVHEPYFRIACRRIADAVNGGVQPELF